MLGVNWFASLLGMQGEIVASDTFERFGQFGDSFGVVTSVATVVALALLFRTYHFQKKEFAGMREFMRRQTAWNVVLQLCEQYREMMAHTVARINVGADGDKEIQGRDGLRELISRALERAEDLKQVEERFGFRSPSRLIPSALKALDVIPFAQSEFNPYEGCFRLLHRIFKFINEEVPEEEQRKYARIPRAMLSNIELEALLINCLTERGEGMKEFVVKFAILNNYTPVDLGRDIALKFCEEYNPDAFGNNLFLKQEKQKAGRSPTP